MATGDLIKVSRGLYCTRCETQCYGYEQGLCCDCDNPWITEVIHREDYPDYWIPITVRISKRSVQEFVFFCRETGDPPSHSANSRGFYINEGGNVVELLFVGNNNGIFDLETRDDVGFAEKEGVK